RGSEPAAVDRQQTGWYEASGGGVGGGVRRSAVLVRDRACTRLEAARRRPADPVLLGLLAKAHQPRATPWPRWVSVVGACLAVAGCLTRLAAQAAVGFGQTPYGGNLSLVLFEGGFLLAGTVLPYLLVHPIGRRFPRWLLLL